MPTISIPDTTYQHLQAEAVARNMDVEAFALQMLSSPSAELPILEASPPEQPLTGEDWARKFADFNQRIQTRAELYPAGYRADDSRDAIYGDREDAQR